MIRVIPVQMFRFYIEIVYVGFISDLSYVSSLCCSVALLFCCTGFNTTYNEGACFRPPLARTKDSKMGGVIYGYSPVCGGDVWRWI